MTSYLKKLKYVLVVIALSALLFPAAYASISYRDAEAPEYYVDNTYTLNVYRSPSLKAEVAEVVPYARNIKRVLARDGWAKVYTVNRVLGYCRDEYLTTKNPNTYNMKMYCQQSEAPFYRCPSVQSAVMGHLYLNDKVRVVAVTRLGDWLRFEHEDGHYYYIQRPRMDTVERTKGQDAWCAKGSMQVYYNPELSTKLGTLYFGQSFQLMQQQGNVAKIMSHSGIVGYCTYSDITTKNPNTYNLPVYTQVSGNFLYRTSTDLSGRVQVEKNTAMTLLAVDENHYWGRVEYKGENYYVPLVYLGTERRHDNFKKVTARTGLHIRAGTKKDSDIVATVPAGTELWLVGATDTRARVATSPDASGHFQTGYVELQYLK